MLKTMTGQMECPRNPGKKFTWWYYEHINRQRSSVEQFENYPTPQFCYEYRDKDGIPVISGYCSICGLIHRLDANSALKIAEEFQL